MAINKCTSMLWKQRRLFLFPFIDAYTGWKSVAAHCPELQAFTTIFFNYLLHALHFSKAKYEIYISYR